MLESIENQDTKNPIMINVLDTLQFLKSQSFDIKFCWVPSHVGIKGNEIADDKAKLALGNRDIADYKIPYSDFIPEVKTFIRSKWQERWRINNTNKGNKLFDILPVIKPFHMNGLKRKDEVVLHRVRIGHSRLTHSYLMEDPDRIQPRCFYCNRYLISIKHLLMECQNFNDIRENYFNVKGVYKK